MNKTFFTIMDGEGNFLNGNLMRKNNENINEAIRFNDLEDAIDYFGELRKDRGFKVVKVNCKLEDIEQIENEELENVIYDCYVNKFNDSPNEIKVKITSILLPFEVKLMIGEHGVHDTKVREKIFEFISE